jgi:hypothetical protein
LRFKIAIVWCVTSFHNPSIKAPNKGAAPDRSLHSLPVSFSLSAQERTAPASQTIRNPTMPKKHRPHLDNLVDTSAHRLSFWHSVVCPSDSAHSRQYEITPELDFLHGSTSHRGHPGPGLHFITLAPLLSAGSSSPLRQYSPSSSLLSSGQEYPHPYTQSIIFFPLIVYIFVKLE